MIEVQSLKRFGSEYVRLETSFKDLEREVTALEKDLEVSGSVRSAEDLQAQLDDSARQLYASGGQKPV